MDYYGCGFVQDFNPVVDFTDVPWRTDLLLAQPVLLYPRPDAVICLDTGPGLGSNIFLEWKPVGGASHYVIQWANNTQMSGPSLRERIIASPATTYELIEDDDVRRGETIYWRVMAINRTSGGASAHSHQRKLTLNCNEQTGRGFDRCTDFDVQMRVNGVEYLSCCDEGVYWLELSYKCSDQFERVLAEVISIEWSIQASPSHGNAAFVKETTTEDYRAIIESCAEESQVIKVCCKVTFADHILGDTFECETCKRVLIDCDTPYHRRPWFPGVNQPYFTAMSIYEPYCTTQPQGYLRSPPCDCDANCVTAEFELIEFTLGDVDFDIEILGEEICDGDTIVDFVLVNTDSVESEAVEVRAYLSLCGKPEVLVATESIDPGTDSFHIPITYNADAFGCDCAVRIRFELGEEEQTVSFTLSGKPKERCLTSDYNIVVATGPVYCIPVDTCQGGIPTECCNCTPEFISFEMTSDPWSGQGVLRHNNGIWESGESFDFFDCEDSLGNPTFLYCGPDEKWIFQTLFSCQECIPATPCPCIPGEFNATLSWDDGTESGSKPVTFQWLSGEVWGATNNIKFTPNCPDQLDITLLAIDFASLDASAIASLPWSASIGNFVTVLSCTPDFEGGFTIQFTHPTCATVTVTVTWDVSNNCGSCTDSLALSYAFYACDPFEATFTLDDPGLPAPINVYLFDAYDYCRCSNDSGGGGETIVLEARVNIPLSCHFKVENGVLSLNLEKLLGPGLALVEGPDGCPYIYSYGGGCNCECDCYTIIYYETIVYCCYYGYEG